MERHVQPFIFKNGLINVCDLAGRTVEAIAVKDGRILAAGALAGVQEAAGPGARTIDLEGKAVMPGVVDVHNHHALGGRAALFELNFAPTLTYEDILGAVRGAARNTPAGRWIHGGSFDSALAARLDTAGALADLDAASESRPVVLRDDSAHNRWCNSAALAAGGITSETPDPPAGRIGRDQEAGTPTGFLSETASRVVDAAMEHATYPDVSVNGQVARKAIEILNALGVTAFQDAYTSLPMVEALAALDRSGDLHAWAVTSMPAHEALYVPGPIGPELFALKEQYRTEHVRPDFAKLMLDGVPMTGTASMLEPYRVSAGFGCCYRGGAVMTLPQLARLLADIEGLGMAAKIHCAGDGASRLALDAIEVLRDFNGPTHLRHQIAHACIIDGSDVARLAKLNVTADLSPMLWFPSVLERALRGAVDDAVIDKMAPIADFLRAGVLVAGGSDWPVSPTPDPWLAMEGMVTRKDPTRLFPGALGLEQAITAMEAMRCYTLSGAQAIGLGDQIGSLEVGKIADFIILDRDPATCAPDDIAETKVLSTWFAGKKVYER